MADKISAKYLIIGNSAGGIHGAIGIREADDTGSIVMVSEEPYPAYSRPLISEHLSENFPLARMLYRSPDFYEKNRIKTFFGNPVMKLDVKGHTAELKDRTVVAWGKLLLATGGLPIILKMPGIEKKGVFSFITLNDAKSIKEYINGSSGRAVVIGGGLIGMSVSEALNKLGVPVTVVELKDYILNAILDAEAGALAIKPVIKAGVNIITGHTVAEITGDADGRVSGVTLDDKSYIPCKLVIMAIGVRPNIELTQGTGIKVNRGILVDKHMETNIPGIYACGDAAEAYDFVYGSDRLTPIWPNASIEGRVAGMNMAGMTNEYPGGTAMNSLKYFGLEMVTAGLVSPPDATFEVVKKVTGSTYRKLILKDGRILGMVFAGNIEKAGIVFGLMKDKINVNAFKNLLVAEELNIAALPKEIWQAKIKVPA